MSGKKTFVQCIYDPFTCSYSMFCEQPEKTTGEIQRWVECECDYQVEVIVKEEDIYKIVKEWRKGIVGRCRNAPPDWWAEYLKRKADNIPIKG